MVGTAAGIGTAIFLDSTLPLSKEDWDRLAAEEAAREEAEELRRAEAERKAREKVVGNFGDDRSLTPMMSSPDITTEEQEAIAAWVKLMQMAQPTVPPDAVLQ